MLHVCMCVEMTVRAALPSGLDRSFTSLKAHAIQFDVKRWCERYYCWCTSYGAYTRNQIHFSRKHDRFVRIHHHHHQHLVEIFFYFLAKNLSSVTIFLSWSWHSRVCYFCASIECYNEITSQCLNQVTQQLIDWTNFWIVQINKGFCPQQWPEQVCVVRIELKQLL